MDAESYIGVKSFKAKGKRLTTYEVAEITELEPLRHPEPETTEEPEDKPEETPADHNTVNEAGEDSPHEPERQMNLFGEDE